MCREAEVLISKQSGGWLIILPYCADPYHQEECWADSVSEIGCAEALVSGILTKLAMLLR